MKFGTSGLRGLVAEMTDPVCAAYVAAFLAHLRAEGEEFAEVLVGQDLRPSSPRIAAACLGAVAGADAVDCGVVPTPALALEAARRGAPAIMVTGSHIPFDRNGLKFYRASGEITKADEAGIAARLAAPAAAVSRTLPGAGVGERYLARCLDFFGPDCLRGLRIGVYQHSAAGRDLITDAIGRAGGAVVGLGRTDAFVAIDTEAVAPEDADRIRRWVRQHRLDALVSTDGDGDRPLIADATGAVLRGDVVGALTARALGADAVATPLNASTALERSGWFPRIVRTRIGSPYVLEAMAALKAEGAGLVVGYEANGGFLLGTTVAGPDGRTLPELPTRDALVPIFALLSAITAEGRPLAELVARLPVRVTDSDRLQEVAEAFAAPLLAGLAAEARARATLLRGLAEAGGATVDTRDGVRMTLGSGEIVHLRMSGNAPELRCYAEAESAERARRLVAEVLTRVQRLRDAAAG